MNTNTKPRRKSKHVCRNLFSGMLLATAVTVVSVVLVVMLDPVHAYTEKDPADVDRYLQSEQVARWMDPFKNYMKSAQEQSRKEQATAQEQSHKEKATAQEQSHKEQATAHEQSHKEHGNVPRQYNNVQTTAHELNSKEEVAQGQDSTEEATAQGHDNQEQKSTEIDPKSVEHGTVTNSTDFTQLEKEGTLNPCLPSDESGKSNHGTEVKDDDLKKDAATRPFSVLSLDLMVQAAVAFAISPVPLLIYLVVKQRMAEQNAYRNTPNGTQPYGGVERATPQPPDNATKRTITTTEHHSSAIEDKRPRAMGPGRSLAASKPHDGKTLTDETSDIGDINSKYTDESRGWTLQDGRLLGTTIEEDKARTGRQAGVKAVDIPHFVDTSDEDSDIGVCSGDDSGDEDRVTTSDTTTRRRLAKSIIEMDDVAPFESAPCVTHADRKSAVNEATSSENDVPSATACDKGRKPSAPPRGGMGGGNRRIRSEIYPSMKADHVANCGSFNAVMQVEKMRQPVVYRLLVADTEHALGENMMSGIYSDETKTMEGKQHKTVLHELDNVLLQPTKVNNQDDNSVENYAVQIAKSWTESLSDTDIRNGKFLPFTGYNTYHYTAVEEDFVTAVQAALNHADYTSVHEISSLELSDTNDIDVKKQAGDCTSQQVAECCARDTQLHTPVSTEGIDNTEEEEIDSTTSQSGEFLFNPDDVDLRKNW